MKKILVPTDFSTQAHNAYRYALHLAYHFGAEIHLYHSYFLDTVTDSLAGTDALLALQKAEEEAAMQNFRLYEMEIGHRFDRPIPVHATVQLGFPADRIVDYALEQHIDLIVMGTLGASNIATRLLGSVTGDVIQRAKCPVLSVPVAAQFDGIRHIAFADESDTETDYRPGALTVFAGLLGADIIPVHLRLALDTESVAEGLNKFAVKHDCQVVAMTTHKRNFLTRLLSPSATASMAYNSKVPVLALHDTPAA